MNSEELIWDLSKKRFLQAEAYYWLLGNKVIEILFIIGLIIFVYFDFYVFDSFKYFKYAGIAIIIITLCIIRFRRGSYLGYFDGYEQGFKDAASRNCDYWDEISEFQAYSAIKKALEEIKNNEKNVSEENMQSRINDIKKGFNKLTGFILTWRKIK